MGEQKTAACMCGHPLSDHPDPATQLDIPPQYRGGCSGDGDDCGCQVYRPRPPITWPAIAAELESIRDQTDRCLRDAAYRLEIAHAPDEGVMQSHRIRGQGLQIVRGRVEALRSHVAESPSPAPARPLEAVLADIKAEGHGRIALDIFESAGEWCCQSRIGRGGENLKGKAWQEAVEDGSAYADTPTAAAEARLAQIRALHEKAAVEPRRAADEVAALDEATLAAEGERRLAEASEPADGEEG